MDAVLRAEDVRAAARRLDGTAHRTPVHTSRAVDELTGSRVFFKCENLQRAGAFKFRGAYNAIARLDAQQRRAGVVAYSSGNHAQAVALACRLLGATAVVVMPTDAPAGKVAATREYGAEVVTYDRHTQDRTAIGRRLAAERGLVLIPPFDHPDVMAGQGTAALELLADAGPLDALVVPVGGGGLIAGCATAARSVQPDLRIVAAEPLAADDTSRSLRAGRRVRIPVPDTIADGLAAPEPGELTFEVNRRLIDEIRTVPEDEVRAAVLLAFERLKLVIEPSAAVAVAALLGGRPQPGERIGVVLSGGNIAPADFARLTR
ncbi:pyridoxal-phosphate dependent enzyme [Saccharopolyspora sp. HNM0983]|uniref:threonine ammonia-lyase n=1 Tax=Saccharopolyspora montiporae TaxID=2781240 RepID=A0A929B8L8_9PSEU|nr:pyridoxal-phosphate dependent enzyme [Saccharopolyspora sp. HNM0983]